MNQDNAVVRGIRTAIQAIIGAFVGLVLVVWAVPGVPEAVGNYLLDNFIPVALAVGIPSGLAGFIWNALRKDVPTT
jgi:hypothetical protein